MTASLRIGEVAERARVSTRTLRYYQELGLLSPSGTSPGGARRYSELDVERLLRIRELQDLLGFDLGEIADVLSAEDALQRLREEYDAGLPVDRREEIVAEAVELNRRLQTRVRAKKAALDAFLAELEDKARRYREVTQTLHDEARATPAGRRD